MVISKGRSLILQFQKELTVRVVINFYRSFPLNTMP